MVSIGRATVYVKDLRMPRSLPSPSRPFPAACISNGGVLYIEAVMTPPSVSVLVNTWNRADFLRNCLQGYLRQTVRNFEIVVADDGSEDHTPEVVETFRRSSGIPIDYVRHERDGHRRTVILNKGIVA